MQTYADALDTLNGKDSRKIAGNTTVVRLDADTIGIVLHQTTIVKYTRDGLIALNSGTWKTPLTKSRMNAFSPISVHQENGEWFAGGVEFFDGIEFASDGNAVRV